jgi:hypothetical protein
MMIRILLSALVVVLAVCLTVGIAYWRIARRFVPGDAHALDGIVQAPMARDIVFGNVAVWDGHAGPVRRGVSVVVREGRIAEILDAAQPVPTGVTTMRVLGDGYCSLAYRDEVARWDVVGPRVLTAGLHVNGPKGYVTGGLAAHLDPAGKAESAVEIERVEDIEAKLKDHIARGVDGLEHIVNVPHELPDEMIQAIRERGIYVCPTLSGSSYTVLKFLHDPELLYEDPDLVANVSARVRKDLYVALRVLKLPGVARVLLRQKDPMRQWELWYQQSLLNTGKLHRAGIHLIFGTDTPFVFGNFFHSVMNEARALKLAGLSNEAILRAATSDAATALRINERVGTIELGKTADLVLLDGDPLADLEALGRVDLVMKEGRIVYVKPPFWAGRGQRTGALR